MKEKLTHTLKIVVLMVLVGASMGMVSLPELAPNSPLSAIIGLQPASASSKYGILGLTAPELALDTWIDSNGNTIAPIRLEDYRGKVVYLYFFQDW